MESVISLHPIVAAMSPASVAPDQSEAADTARKIARAREEILDEYRQKHRYPWVVAYSGGKDSTMVLQLVFEMLLALKPEERRREIHVVGNDTLVESPPVIEHLRASVEKIRKAAQRFNLPLSAAVTKPDIDQTFWVNVIGRGYAPPSRIFRWCTDRMKIQPTNGYILRRVHERGSVILLIGARRAESANRRRTMDKYHRRGRLSKHPSLAKCRMFSPISELETDEVWMTLLQRPSPWGGTHRDLVTLYRNARGGECPTVLSKEDVPSCGTTSPRFGCWTCTVVPKDRSMAGLIDSGFELFEPLMEFRDWLQKIRSEPEEYRMKTRRDGTVRYSADGGVIYGPFTLDTRRMILKKLRQAEEESDRALISQEEVDLIRDIWREDAVMDKIRSRRYLIWEPAYA